MNLPSSHRRSLSVTARVVEEAIDEVEKILLKTDREKMTHHIEDSYDREEKKEILDVVSRLRKANEDMFRSLGLEPRVTQQSQVVKARTTHLWTVLRDSKSRSMKRYGILPPETATEVDRHIDNLLGILKQLP